MLEAGKAERTPAGPVTIGDPHHDKPLKGDVGGLRIYDRALTQAEAEALALHEPIRYILAQDESKRTKEQNQRLLDYFLTYDAAPELRRVYAELNELKTKLAQTRKEIVTTQVMAEMAKPRDTFILGRGDYRNQTEKVTPGVPAMLPPMPKDAPANRLGLAQWLFSPQHPLTARVAVNRYWQLYFGTGLVKTTEDFGSQGDAPVQRDVLDWLATEFQSNWDVKAMQRLIVTSATYRQSSQVSAELLEKDPENRLLARGPRFRLPAEMVRDNALAVSGLLNREHRRPERLPLSAARALGRTVARRDLHRAGVSREHGPRSLPAQHVHVLEAHRAARRAHHLRCARPREVHLAPPDHQHAAAGPGAAQRSDLRGSGARPGAARAPGGARRCRGARPLSVPRGHGAARHAGRTARAAWSWRSASSNTTRKIRQQAAKLIAIGASKAGNVEAAELAAWTTVASTILNLDETITKE